MRWPAAQLAGSSRVSTAESSGSRPRSRRLLAFATVELLLAMAIPFLAIEGYHTLLGSRSGTLIDEPTRTDPGWAAVVSPTPITGIAEVVDGMTTGLTLVVPSMTRNETAIGGGTAVLIAGNTLVATPDGEVKLSELEPPVALRTLAQSMKLTLESAKVMDAEAWSQTLGDKTYQLDNPDPVPDSVDTAGTLAFTVGPVTVDGSGAAVFLGRPVESGSLSSLGLRRRMFWEAIVADPPIGTHHLSRTLTETFGTTGGQVVDLPTTSTASGPELEGVAAEELVRTIVGFPSGERLKMRVVDRTGSADLEAVAAAVAGRGIEVVEIANAGQFDDGDTELIVPPEVSIGQSQLAELATELGLKPLVDHELGSTESTLLVGIDFDVDALGWRAPRGPAPSGSP